MLNLKRKPETSRVLVVEDEEQVLSLTEALLIERGFSVTTSQDGETALESLKDSAFDVIILDLNLPGMDGLDVISEVRAQSQVPVIVVSARTDGKDRIDAFERGADDFLTKPFLPKELLARMNVCLRRTRRVISKRDGGFFKNRTGKPTTFPRRCSCGPYLARVLAASGSRDGTW